MLNDFKYPSLISGLIAFIIVLVYIIINLYLTAQLEKCEEYGYSHFEFKGFHKYCGIKDEEGNMVWQKLSYIKRKSR